MFLFKKYNHIQTGDKNNMKSVKQTKNDGHHGDNWREQSDIYHRSATGLRSGDCDGPSHSHQNSSQ